MPLLLFEYIGGPRDGDRSCILRSTPRGIVEYPPEIKAVAFDLDGRTETVVGRYVRDHMGDDNETMRYLWVHASE